MALPANGYTLSNFLTDQRSKHSYGLSAPSDCGPRLPSRAMGQSYQKLRQALGVNEQKRVPCWQWSMMMMMMMMMMMTPEVCEWFVVYSNLLPFLVPLCFVRRSVCSAALSCSEGDLSWNDELFVLATAGMLN